MKMPMQYALHITACKKKKKAFQSVIIHICPVSVITKNKIIMLIEPMDYKFLGINDLGQIRKGEVALFELQYLTE